MIYLNINILLSKTYIVSSSIASLFGGYLVRGDLKPLETYEDNINSKSASKVKEVAKKYFNFDKSTTVILKKSE